MNLSPYYELRDGLADFLESDLTGPRHDDAARREEVIDNWPLTRYATGILYPRQGGQMAPLDPEQDEADVADEDDGNGERESPVALANMRYPSSMGCSFAVDCEVAPFITVCARAARYINHVPGDSFITDGEETLQMPEPDAPRSYGRRPGLWKRQPLDIAPITIDVSKNERGKTHPDFRAPGLSLFYRARETSEGYRAVTLILVNEQNQPPNEKRDAYCIFNAQLEVSGHSDATEAFVERAPRGAHSNDDEVRSSRLLYRHAREFATGHGIAVEWDKITTDSARATAIRTQWTPRFEVLSADANPGIGSPFLEFKKLAGAEREDVTRGLDEFCDAYRSWIDAQEAAIPGLDLGAELEATARGHLETCRHIASRMKSGVEILREDPLSWRAWQLANRAMLRQRARANWLKGGKPTAAPDESASGLAWRPFQLGFILLCLESIARPESRARQIADLLWFPTGGGKTEAYLGLIAFCTLRRRLEKRDDGAGVTALMRYTLRLLTLQQFERATLLICSLESLRREMEAQLGSAPISVGLWLGNAATPNTIAEAERAIKVLRDKGDLENSFNQTGNPVQVRNCPWCGAALDAWNYTFTHSKPKRMVVACRKDGCEFGDGLPVHLVDEDVYRARPTLLIATVDKFASLPWRGDDTASLFGFKTQEQRQVPPPELIIQDELHLISGPLGTMVGLYETAIDLACETAGRRPKIVASTATIRRAKDQGRALFNRRVEQFPPPALDARDSYFARQASSETKASRCYLGVMANGLSNANATNRIYAALLQGVAQLPGADTTKDPYWTLVGYFNSLRVLGSTLLQVADVVPDYMQSLATQSGADMRPMSEERRIEMNSRVSSSDVPKFLKRMDAKYPAISGRSDEAPLDVILATNMISVGVDINRLGLMSVMGQPQATSEYIQATSRVGREFPGLVVVQFNPARSRDRSHYESFESYHNALYRQVEATSVTPFSARARDRGLHAVLVALARQRVGGLRENESAERVGDFDGALDEIIKAIVARVSEVTGDSVEAEATRVHLNEIRDNWKQRAEDESLKYRAQTLMDSLLCDAGDLKAKRSDCLPTLWSLRDVDAETNLYFHRIQKDIA